MLSEYHLINNYYILLNLFQLFMENIFFMKESKGHSEMKNFDY